MAYINPLQGQPQAPYPAPIVYYAAPAITYQSTVTKNFVQFYARQTSTTLGALTIALGCISIACGIVLLVYDATLSSVGTGIWCGIFHIIAGSIATAAGQQPTNELIVGTTVCSTFNILFGITQLAMASIAVADDIYCDRDYTHYDYCPNSKDTAVAVNSLMIGVGALIIISGFWLMGISARAIDKGSKAQSAIVPVAFAATQPEALFIQAPALQPQPIPGYYYQLQYPSTANTQQVQFPAIPNSHQQQYQVIPNSQQMMNAGDHQAPPMYTKPEDNPPRY